MRGIVLIIAPFISQGLILPVDLPMQLRVDEAAAFKHIISVVDVLKAKQFERLSIQTEQVP